MNELTHLIKSLIHKSGPITFARFMQLALYDSEHGYYGSGKARIGKRGDYYTSPCVHSAFGETIGRFISKCHSAIDTPDLMTVEAGAGKGFLALDILDSLKRDNRELYDRTRYIIIEPSQSLWKVEREILKEHINKIEWTHSMSSLETESVSGVFISNELVDSFPFHRAKLKDDKLKEIFVALCGEEFVEISGEPTVKELGEYFEGYGLEFEDGQEVEINLNAGRWLADAASVLAKGFILTIDYGFLAQELFNPPRMKGTYRCFYKHTASENPYQNIGEQDITADVDFSNLIKTGDLLGLHTVKYATQGQFLIDWGILDIMNRYSSTDAFADKNRAAVKTLFLPGLMGDRFKVLVQTKNLRGMAKNFYPESPLTISFPKATDSF